MSLIKSFGRSGIEQLIDKRLELTKIFQIKISERRDLLLLNETDINSCMFMFIPEEYQLSKLSVPDMEKINECNLFIKQSITEDGIQYLHGFNLKKVYYHLHPEDCVTYVLRTINGNPHTRDEHVDTLLDNVVSLGRQFFSERTYLYTAGSDLLLARIVEKLKIGIANLLENYKHATLIYGSSISPGNAILHDIDLMIIAEDSCCTSHRTEELINFLIQLYSNEGIAIDCEVPYNRKLLVPISFVERTPTMLPYLDAEVQTVIRSDEYLSSDEMLHRLVMNVMTVPTLCISGSDEFIATQRYECERTLLKFAKARMHGEDSVDNFVRVVSGDGIRSGENYLGYKERPNVREYLKDMYTRITTPVNTHHQPCVLLLNGFPGVGKLSIAQELQNMLNGTNRIIDNHLLIDPVEAIEPGRTVAFDSVKSLEDPNLIIIMTACLVSTVEDRLVFAEYVDIARTRNIPLIFVNIICSKEANAKRLANTDRTKGKTKLTDVLTLNNIRHTHTLLEPQNITDINLQYTTVDTTTLDVKESAQKVLMILNF